MLKKIVKDIHPRKQLLSKMKEVRKEEVNLERKIQFVSSGCSMLNLALTGNINKGYPIGRVINILGNYSSGKTLMSSELINSVWYEEHKKKGKSVHIVYNDAEFAFDEDLAEEFNMPLDQIEFKHSRLVEEFHKDLYTTLKDHKDKDLIIYILDSLDALSDEGEQGRMVERLKGKETSSYGMGKAKYLSEMFRSIAGDISKTNCILYVISQVRENINAGMFGEKFVRGGGRAMDFYASQVIMLKLTKTIKDPKSKIVQGIEIDALIKKNKCAPPKREVGLTILHGYGVDNISSLLDFCLEHKKIKQAGAFIVWLEDNLHRKDLIKHIDDNKSQFERLKELAQETWNEIEKEAKMDRKKKWLEED